MQLQKLALRIGTCSTATAPSMKPPLPILQLHACILQTFCTAERSTPGHLPLLMLHTMHFMMQGCMLSSFYTSTPGPGPEGSREWKNGVIAQKEVDIKLSPACGSHALLSIGAPQPG